jgi:hypothetical protein
VTRVEFTPGWEEHLTVPQDELLERLGVEIEGDAKAHCPVESGRLRDSIRHTVDAGEVQVGSDLPYAGDVEEGHRIVAWGHETGRLQPPDPFLRPALYKPRDA